MRHQFEKSAIKFAEEKFSKNDRIGIIKWGERLSFVRKIKRIKKWREQGAKCHYCRTHINIHQSTYDHIIPQVHGGSEHYDNFVVACKPCNSTRGDMDYALFCNIVTSPEDLASFKNTMQQAKQIRERNKKASIEYINRKKQHIEKMKNKEEDNKNLKEKIKKCNIIIMKIDTRCKQLRKDFSKNGKKLKLYCKLKKQITTRKNQFQHMRNILNNVK